MLRASFGLLLIYSGIPKLADPFTFSTAVKNYRVLGTDASRLIAVFFPVLEIAAGALLITGFWRRAAVWLNALMMGAFLLLTGQAYVRGLDISCGCFYLDEGKITFLKLLFNAVLAAAAVLLVRETERRDLK